MKEIKLSKDQVLKKLELRFEIVRRFYEHFEIERRSNEILVTADNTTMLCSNLFAIVYMFQSDYHFHFYVHSDIISGLPQLVVYF